MPTPRKNQKPAAENPAPEVEAATPVDVPLDAEPETADVEAVPLNRAERRAKGKRSGQTQPAGRGKVGRSTGPTAGPRIWANRRSG